MNTETFGELIKKKIRKAQGKALRELAAAIDFDQSLLSKIERNRITAPAKIIQPLAKALDLDYKDFQIKSLSEKLYHSLKDVDYSIEDGNYLIFDHYYGFCFGEECIETLKLRTYNFFCYLENTILYLE